MLPNEVFIKKKFKKKPEIYINITKKKHLIFGGGSPFFDGLGDGIHLLGAKLGGKKKEKTFFSFFGPDSLGLFSLSCPA